MRSERGANKTHIAPRVNTPFVENFDFYVFPGVPDDRTVSWEMPTRISRTFNAKTSNVRQPLNELGSIPPSAPPPHAP